MMNAVFKYFAKRIVIDLHPSRFTFSINEEDVNISFAPFIYLAKDELIWVPIAIGEEIPIEDRVNLSIRRVDLKDLENVSSSEPIVSSEVFLQILFEYGIGKCFERYWFPQLRPVVFILGANRFSEQFKNPKEMFEFAAKRGGARLVVIDKTEL